MDPTSSNDVEYDLYHQDVSPVLSTEETSTFDIESPGTVKTNVEVAVQVVYPGEEPTLKPAHSTELMTEAISFVEPDPNAPVDNPTCEVEMPGLESDNIEVAKSAVCPAEEETLSLVHSTELMTMEVISFVEADTNAPVETSTCVIETIGPNMENVAVAAPPTVVSLTEVQALSSGEKKSDKQTSIIDQDNIEVAKSAVCPVEEETLSLAHSTELMTTEVISFVEAETNAPVDTPTYEIEIPGPESDNIEVAKSAVCPAEEETLSLAHSTELMTTEVISFVEADTNAPVETSTCVIETFGPNMENVAVAAPPAVVSLTEVQALSSGEKKSDKQTSIIDKDKTVPLEKKKSRFLSALRRGLRRVFKTICCCGCSAASSGEEDYKDEFTHEIEAFNERLSV
ncbi:unnamed protein product [Aphis gossypii]|uniref:Uncharacterized protein n=1 Tax=Aphis gossypii TaxID=80765 RepID=A0A9P0IXQ6_APHGO|nr:unnamed protein product [Aphis gossypii]